MLRNQLAPVIILLNNDGKPFSPMRSSNSISKCVYIGYTAKHSAFSISAEGVQLTAAGTNDSKRARTSFVRESSRIL